MAHDYGDRQKRLKPGQCLCNLSVMEVVQTETIEGGTHQDMRCRICGTLWDLDIKRKPAEQQPSEKST